MPILNDNLMDDEVDDGRYGNVIRMLKSLSITDQGVKEYFILKSQNKNVARNIIRNEIIQCENYIINIDINKWNDKINTVLWTKTDSFMVKYLELKKWIELNNRLPSKHSENEEEKRLGIWIGTLREGKKKGRLDEHKIKIIETIPNWFWYQDVFYNRYNDLEEWIKINNRIPSSTSKDEIERRLGVWCRERRQDKKEGKLDDDKIKKLDNLTFWFWEKDISENNYNELKEWIKNNKRIPSQTSKDEIEKRLGLWCSKQRQNKKKGKLDENKIKKLENIDNWIWSPEIIIEKKSFEDTYNEFKEWISNNKRIPSANSKDEIEKRLGSWCNKQRQSKKKGNLDEDKIKKLENLSFWFWEKDDPFNNNIYKYVKFIEENKRIPSTISKNETEKFLAIWANNQRLNKKKNTLDEERIKKLETINGWYWSR